jgi:hypothetical protein
MHKNQPNGVWVNSVERYRSAPNLSLLNPMVKIRDIVQQALINRCLDLTAEAQLKQLLHCPYDSIDLKAYLALRQAILVGQVKQASREFRDRRFEPTKGI